MMKTPHILIITFLLSAPGCTVEVVYPGDGVARFPEAPDEDVTNGADAQPVEGVEQVVAAQITAQTIKPFQLTSVEPKSGPVEGGTRITIEGFRLEDVVQVYFGGAPASEFVSLGQEAIRADSPPGVPGPVDISVLRSNGTQATLEGAFRYLSAVEVGSIKPAKGPMIGGTQFQIDGKGFGADSVVLVAGRKALLTEVVNGQKIVGVTPWGSSGPADVIVASGGAFGRLKDGFEYLMPLEASHLFPPGVPTSGGVTTLVGEGLEGTETVYLGGNETSLLTDWLGAAVTIGVNPSPAGVVDAIVERGEDWQRLEGAFLFYDETGHEGEKLLHMAPTSGNASGGQRTWLFVTSDQPDLNVVWGGTDLIAREVAVHVYEVSVPPGSGTVSVHLDNGGDDSRTYRYVVDPTLALIKPDEGDQAGGTVLELVIEGALEAPQFFFGPLPATDVVQLDNGRYQLTTPRGSVGPCPVRVVSGEEEVTWPGAFTYTSLEQNVFAMKPGEGAESGGTLFRVFGEGFVDDVRVFFGNEEASQVVVVSEGELLGLSPPGNAGAVDVRVELSNQTTTFSDAYTYFNPSSSFGGTWGGALDETLNVTVLDGGTGEGVPEASVFVGTPGGHPQEALTNAQGQVSFGEIGLVGEQVVTAVKEGYTSNSVVAFDSTNVVLLLYSVVPNPGEPPPPPPPPGVISGRVLGTEKFSAPPPSGCVIDWLEGQGCAPCGVGISCSEGYQCSPIDKGQNACTKPCQEDSDCEAGMRCGLIEGETDLLCIPSQWQQGVECSLSNDSFFGALVGPDDWLPAVWSESFNSFTYTLDSSPGEVAVFCRGGWRDIENDTFIAKKFGVRRHVFVQPGASLTDQDVPLEFTLDRELDVRQDRAGVTYGPGTLYTVDVLLELGTDGWKNMGSRQSFDPNESLLIANLPKQLSGVLYDASYFVYGGIYAEDVRGVPYSVAQEDDVLPESSAQVFGLSGGTWVPFAEELDRDIFGADKGPDDAVWAVGARGTILSGDPETGWTAHYSPTDADLNAISMANDTLQIIVGDEGTILEKKGFEWIEISSPTKKDLRGVWVGGGGEAWAVGWYVVLKRTAEGAWAMVEAAPDLPYESITGFGADALFFGAANGTVVEKKGSEWLSKKTSSAGSINDFWGVSASLVFASSSAGEILVGVDGEWSSLEPLPVATQLSALDGKVLNNSIELWAVGKGGVVWKYQNGGWLDFGLSVKTSLEDVIVVEGQASPIVVGRSGIELGPFMAIPDLSVVPPLDGQPWKVSLTVPGEVNPAFRFGQVLTEGGYPIWTWMIDGDAEGFQLPDLETLASWSLPAVAGNLSLRVYSVYDPFFDIDQYNNFELNLLEWESWSLQEVDLAPTSMP